MLLAKDIRDRERGGRAQIGVVEGGEEDTSPDLMKVLESKVGERPQEIKPAVSDEVADQRQKANISLYRCVDKILPDACKPSL